MESRRDSYIAWIPVHLKLFYTFEQFKAILEKNTLILHCKTTCCYRTTSPSSSITLEASMTYTPVWVDSGWEIVKRGRHAVLFTAVHPMFVDQHKEVEYDLTKPRIAVYKHNWKVHQNTVYWCNLRVAQSKGLQLYRTRSNAIILFNTLPALCIEKVVNMKSGGEVYSKMHQSPEFPQRIVLKPNLHHGRQDYQL